MLHVLAVIQCFDPDLLTYLVGLEENVQSLIIWAVFISSLGILWGYWLTKVNLETARKMVDW